MTKEQFTEHWEMMKAFKDGTEILRYYDKEEEWEAVEHPRFMVGRLYVINDKHVKERQAFALGKRIECRQMFQDWLPIENPTFSQSICYRVAEEEPTYYYKWEKLGDRCIVVSAFITDEYAKDENFEEEGYRKIESSKRTWEEN